MRQDREKKSPMASQDKTGIASSLGSIADVYNLKKDYKKALKYNQQALDMCREIDNMNNIVYNLLEIGKIHFSMSNFDKAAPFWRRLSL